MTPAGPSGGGGRSGVVIAWVGWWVASAALYLVLVDTVVLPELVTGAVIAAIGASGATLVRAQRRVVMRPRASWLVALWRPLASYPRDLWTLTRALARREAARGRLYAVPFAHGTDDARSAARRVFGPTAGSIRAEHVRRRPGRGAGAAAGPPARSQRGPCRGRRPVGAQMNEWLIAALVLLVALVPAGAVAFRARPTSGLVALQVAGSNATLILLLLSQGFGRQPFVDLALIAGVMSFIGSVVLAGFIEQAVR